MDIRDIVLTGLKNGKIVNVYIDSILCFLQKLLTPVERPPVPITSLSGVFISDLSYTLETVRIIRRGRDMYLPKIANQYRLLVSAGTLEEEEDDTRILYIRDIFRGLPPLVGRIPSNEFHVNYLSITLIVQNIGGIAIGIRFLNNDDPSKLTYFANPPPNGGEFPLFGGSTMVLNLDISDTVIRFRDLYIDFLNTREYAQIQARRKQQGDPLIE